MEDIKSFVKECSCSKCENWVFKSYKSEPCMCCYDDYKLGLADDYSPYVTVNGMTYYIDYGDD